MPDRKKEYSGLDALPAPEVVADRAVRAHDHLEGSTATQGAPAIVGTPAPPTVDYMRIDRAAKPRGVIYTNLSTRIPADLYVEVKAYAETTDQSLTNLVTRALRHALAHSTD